MIEKITKYTAIIMRYTMDKEELTDFKVSHDICEIISEIDSKVTVDVVEHRLVSEKYKL